MSRVLLPGAPGYDGARRVWNAAIDRRPAAIVECGSLAEVQAGLGRARGERRKVAVRGGGHSVAGHAVLDGAVTLDLRGLRGVVVRGDLVSVGGGCTWGEVIARLAPLGLATPGGFDARVGVAGLTLGGGYGMLSRVLGMSCDNLAGADVVLADGSLVRAEDDPDLLWALRGAGAGFGVVTTLRLRLHRLPPVVAGVLVFPLDGLVGLLSRYRDWVAGVHDEVTAYLGVETAREGPGRVVITVFHVGAEADAQGRLAGLRELGRPLRSELALCAYAGLHEANHHTFPEGFHHAWRTHLLRELDDGAVHALAEHAVAARDLGLYVVVEQLGGAIGRVAPTATAFPHRRAPFGVAAAVKWQPPEVPDAALRAAGALHAALAGSSIGFYANYLGAEAGEAEVARAYGENLPRLRELKRRYDPDGLFASGVSAAG